MEGYVTIKGTFSSPRVWMVLDGQELTYYERLDEDAQQPRNVKGFLSLRDASVAKLDPDTLRFGVKLKASKGKLSFSCPDEQAWGIWFSAATRAARAHLKERERQQQLLLFRQRLGIEATAPLSKGELSRRYRALSLREHPDKGGDPAAFASLREAYAALCALQAEQDECALCRAVRYEATLERAPGVGLGLSVGEDAQRQQLLVTSLHPSARVVALSEESGGEIRPGDALVGIGESDVARWTVLRVRARLGGERVALGGRVLLTFERRVPREEGEGGEEERGGVSPMSSPLPTPRERGEEGDREQGPPLSSEQDDGGERREGRGSAAQQLFPPLSSLSPAPFSPPSAAPSKKGRAGSLPLSSSPPAPPKATTTSSGVQTTSPPLGEEGGYLRQVNALLLSQMEELAQATRQLFEREREREQREGERRERCHLLEEREREMQKIWRESEEQALPPLRSFALLSLPLWGEDQGGERAPLSLLQAERERRREGYAEREERARRVVERLRELGRQRQGEMEQGR